jgi:aromatic ring hydroxylase
MRTGEKYLQDLQDGRRFLWRGQWIENIASHNRFIHGAIAVSEYYHFQKEHASSQTYSQKDQLQPLSYTTIDSKELLRLRSNAFEKWSTASCGTLSRSPDYMNTVLTAMAQFATEDSTNEFSGHIRSFYQKAKAEDLCLTHTCINWSMNKSADRESDCSSPLKIVEKNSRGLWVSGARSVATLAPYSDWLLCFL